MYRSSLFPLRTIVGNAVPIVKASSIRKIFESPESKNRAIEYDFSLNSAIIDTSTDLRYSQYLPSLAIDGVPIYPGEGMDTLPVMPGPRPFNNIDRVISFFALSKQKATTDVSRELSARFSITLPGKFLIGGICFGGFPYAPYSRRAMNTEGAHSSNFGLPREVRLTCAGASTGDIKDTSLSADFLDSEISATKQEVVSHSGFNFLRIDPTLTDVVTVHFSDYPTILAIAKFGSDTYSDASRYGFIIPYFYIFTYKEKTRYRPIVTAGLLGTTSNHKANAKDLENDALNSIDYRHVLSYGDTGTYFDFTAASIFGQQRLYTVRDEPYDGHDPQGSLIREFREAFISFKVPPTKHVVLFIEQGEEYERCVAGLKIFLPFVPKLSLADDLRRITEAIREFYPDSPDLAALADDTPREELESFLRKFLKIPDEIDFCERIGLSVYEIDPSEGVSPLAVPLDGRFATLLAHQIIDELSEISLALILQGVRFVRPSNSRFFAIKLTNLDDRPGQFVVKGMKLVQSAHVSVHPRAARTQQIRTLHFRIIGPDLAEDYSLLGSDGFNFSIERLIAGERKSVLFRANSLLDLLHTGVARIHGNVRRRSVEFETAETVGGSPNFESRRSSVTSAGWRRAELGSDLAPVNAWTGEGLQVDNSNNKFESFMATETRSHTRLLYPQNDNEWNAAKTYFGLITDIITIGTRNNPIPNDNGRLNAQWRNPRWNSALTFGTVRGLRAVSVSPFSSIAALEEFITRLHAGDGAAALADFVTLLLATPAVLLTAGTNTSIMASPGGVGASLGIAPYPTLFNNSTFGSTGSVTKTGSEAIYSYSQALNHGLDVSSNVTHVDEAVSNRKVSRVAVEGTDRQRIKGAEVMWQGELVDIITGSIPLDFTLPATAGKLHFRTSDESLRVRFGSGVGTSIAVDFWFDLTEEILRDDN